MASKSLVKSEAETLTAPGSERQLEALRKIAAQETPKEEIRWRKGRGGAQLPYTDPAYVIRTLNEAFNHNWDFEADNEELLCIGERPFEVKVRGRLTVRLGGQAVTKVQFGCQPIEFLQKDGTTPVSLGDAFKGAASDALKKCASLLGVALDLYDSDSPVHNGGSNGNGDQGGGRQASRPQPCGTAGQILALTKALGWDDQTLAGEIHARFEIALSPENLTEALATLPYAESQELIQALKAELESRNRTK